MNQTLLDYILQVEHTVTHEEYSKIHFSYVRKQIKKILKIREFTTFLYGQHPIVGHAQAKVHR